MTRRPASFAPLAGAALLVGVLCLFAQSTQSRDGYRAAYRTWREADPGLERDAGAAGDALTPRAARAADAAAAYGAVRLAFLADLASQHAQNLQWLRDAEAQSLPDLSPAVDLLRFTNQEMGAVSASIATFANDPDRGIQQVRQASQRELAALQALKAAITDRQSAGDAFDKAASAAEQARAKVLEQYPYLASVLAQSTEVMKQEAAAWAAYYPALAEASRTASTIPVPPPVSNAPVSGAPVSTVPAATAPVSSLPSEAAPAPARAPSITLLPLSRYVGMWAFQAGGLFHGNEPEVVDVTVREENGHATGTLSARFKVPPGGTGDPALRFEFSGDFQATRNQTFALKTADGAKGSIELIPGGPFNVLEVNFETEVKPGKVHQGDALLVKQ